MRKNSSDTNSLSAISAVGHSNNLDISAVMSVLSQFIEMEDNSD